MSLSPAGSPSRRALLFRELARLTGAGIPMEKAAEILGRAWHGKESVRAMAALRTGIARGETIAQALSPALYPVEGNVIRAAEAGGRLDDGFRHLERYYLMLGAAQARVRKALIYPLVLLHAATVLPALVGAVLGGTSPVVAVLKSLVILYLCLAVICGVAWILVRQARSNIGIDRILTRIPFVGAARRAMALARWSAVLHYHVISGARISTGLRLAGETTASAVLERASRRAADSIEAGNELGPALRMTNAFPEDFTAAVTTAELSGTLDIETARQVEERMAEGSARLDTASEWIPRVIYTVICVITIFMIFKIAKLYFTTLVNFADGL